MTDAEKMLARAIRPGLVTYCPGIGTKRFASDMAWRAEHNPLAPLTAKQHAYLVAVAIKFRAQIPRDIVALARRLEAEDKAAASVEVQA